MTDTQLERISWDKTDLQAVQSYSDALELLNRGGVTVATIEDFGDGFILTDKETLLKSPFVILGYNLFNGTYGEAVAIRLVTEDGRKCLITDGGEGIRKQCQEFAAAGVKAIVCPRGLTVSNYFYLNEKTGKEEPAQTYYIGG